MDHPDPIAIKLYIDDLVRLSIKHGLRLRQYDDHTLVEPVPDDWHGYNAPMGDTECCLTIERLGPPTISVDLEDWQARGRPASIQSIDPTLMNAHERLALRFGTTSQPASE